MYWADHSEVNETETNKKLTKKNISDHNYITGGYIGVPNTTDSATLEIPIESREKYDIFGFLYNASITLNISSMSFTSSETDPTANWISRETFGGEQYEGSAKALKFSVTPGSNAIDSIKVSKGDNFAEKTGLNLTGSTKYEYGIVVNDIVNYNDLSIEINDTNVDVDVEAAEEVSE